MAYFGSPPTCIRMTNIFSEWYFIQSDEFVTRNCVKACFKIGRKFGFGHFRIQIAAVCVRAKNATKVCEQMLRSYFTPLYEIGYRTLAPFAVFRGGHFTN